MPAYRPLLNKSAYLPTKPSIAPKAPAVQPAHPVSELAKPAAGKGAPWLAVVGIVLGSLSLSCGLGMLLLLIVGQSTTPPMYKDSQGVLVYLLCFTAPVLVVGASLFAGGLYAHRRAAKTEKQQPISPSVAPVSNPAGTLISKDVQKPEDKLTTGVLESRNEVEDMKRESTLRMLYPGEFFLADAKINVLLDGKFIGVGSAKKGLDVTVMAASGRHVLTLQLGGIRKKEFSIELKPDTEYEAHLTYDRTWGNFSNNLELRIKPPEGQVNSNAVVAKTPQCNVQFDADGKVISVEVKQGSWAVRQNQNNKYYSQRANSLLEASEILKNLSSIPPFTYYMVDTPDGSLGRDIDGFYTEAPLKTKNLNVEFRCGKTETVQLQSLDGFGDMRKNQAGAAHLKMNGQYARLVLMMKCGNCGYDSPIETVAGDLERECYCCGTNNKGHRFTINVVTSSGVVEI